MPRSSMSCWLAVTLLATSLVANVFAANKRLQVTLESSWRATSLAAEASEFFADRDLQQFWTFVESIENGDLASIRGAAQPLLRSPSDSALFEFALGLRVYSPRVEAARQALAVSPCDANAAAVALVFPDDVSAEAHVACSATQLQSLLSSSSSGAAATVTSALGRMSLDFDRAFVGSGQRRRVIVHGALGTAAFAAMHSVLKSGGVGYVFRHFDAPAIAEQRSKVPLGGFGVELSLKSVEYKSFDDAAVKDAEGQQKANANAGGDDDGEVMGIQFATLRNRHPQHADSLSKLQEYLYSRDTGFEELRVWEMQSLGVHAAQRVASATDPLALLRQLSSEFPTYATSLSRVKTNESFVGELRTMQQYVHEGHTNHLVLNGRMIDPRKVDAFELYSIVADELNRVAVLDALRISPSDAARLAAIDLSVVPPARFNVPLDRALVLCDLEKDAAYSRWSKSLNAYVHFTPSWHAQFPQVRRNLFTAVFVIEPTSLMSVYSMAMLQRVVMQRFPMRVALLLATPAPRADLSATDLVKLATARAFLAFASELSDLEPSSAAWPGATGLADALALFNAVAQSARQYVPIKSIEQLQEAIGMLTHSYPGLDLTPATLVRGGEHHARVDSLLDSMRAQIEELGLSSDITEPVAFLNGEVISGDDAVNNAIRDMMNAGVKMREAIVNKVITDETVDLYATLLTSDGAARPALPRFNRYVSVTPQRPLTFVALGGAEFTPLLSSLPYLREAEFEFESVHFSHLIAGDLNRVADRTTVRSLLTHLRTAQHSRLGLIDCSGTGATNRAVRAALAVCGERLAKCNAYVTALLDLADGSVGAVTSSAAASATGIDSAKFDAAWQSAGDVATTHEPLCRLWRDHVVAARTVLLTNGRQLVLDAGDRWSGASDWAHLEAHEHRHAALIEALEATPLRGVSADELTTRYKGDLLQRLMSIFGLDLARNVRKIVLPAGLPTHVSLGERDKCALSVRAILDPLSVSAQRAAPLLEALSSGFGACIQLSLNPVQKLDRLPLKTYYQYVLPVRPTADGASNDVHAMFAHLPADRLLTLALDVPSRWLTDGVDARYDLDNIRLSQLPPHETTLQATFELSAILVEGNCADANANGEAPRGLQLLLSDERRSRQVDTLVMSNFGYFQLKARPGVWNLSLVAGRSSELYAITASDDEQAARLPQQHAVVDSFGGAFVQLHVRRNAGFETAPLLTVDEGEAASQQDAAERMQRFMRGEANDGSVSNARRQYRERLAARAENGTIHVFSVVTGHLYERLLRIMMLSVRRRTQNPVKFWLLSNYLSPHFRQLLPAMARKYNFEYELVTYRWPAWLLAQTNKQRIIWGYKVLFLDVLFPLDLERVIFVDADQVVRGDLKELMALDLEGAPYALTPFCDDRPDMDGYRFWKKGYWHDQLRGRPYHISALYIIDLATFRRLAAGDIIRATYQRLVGSDPDSSLANLDQDSLNVLQDQLPIYSLPQRVLWCETWCSSATFEQALTIDLCNNPQTKEKKLDMARRIIPEWTPLDTELRTWLDEWEASQSTINVAAPAAAAAATKESAAPRRDHSEL